MRMMIVTYCRRLLYGEVLEKSKLSSVDVIHIFYVENDTLFSIYM